MEVWLKGGLRYMKLKKVIQKHCAPELVEAFFIGRSKRTPREGPLNPFSFLRRENVVVVTRKKLVVLKLKMPGIFRAAIARAIYESTREDSDATWIADHLVVSGVEYWPISFHEDDARQVAHLLEC